MSTKRPHEEPVRRVKKRRRSASHRRWASARWIALACLVGAGTAWLASAELIRRTQAARIPPVPDLAAAPEPVRRQIAAADGVARSDAASGAAVGGLAMAYHAGGFNPVALQVYALAATIDPRDARWPYYRGILFEERGDQQAALREYEQVTAVDPRRGAAWFHIAEIELKGGDRSGSEQSYRRAADAPIETPATANGVTRKVTVPLSAYGELGLVRVLVERGALERARDELDRLLSRHPSFGAARQWRRQLQEPSSSGPERSGSYVPPADAWLDAVVAQSNHPDVLLKYAALAGRGGDTAWREMLARRALAASPTGLDVLMEMSSLLQATGRHTEALEFLRRAKSVAPDDHHVLVEEGKSLADLGRLEEAEAVLRQAVRVRDAAAEYNLATVLDRQLRWDEARGRYERALAIDPFHVRALNNLGVGLDRRGQTPAALALFARAMAIDPAEADVLSNLGTALINERRFGEAVDVLTTAVAVAPGAANAHNNLGIALAQSGKLADAAAQFTEALRLDPRHHDARANLDAVNKAAR